MLEDEISPAHETLENRLQFMNKPARKRIYNTRKIGEMSYVKALLLDVIAFWLTAVFVLIYASVKITMKIVKTCA